MLFGLSALPSKALLDITSHTSCGALETFSPGVASMRVVHPGDASSTASSMEAGTPPPGTYNVGFCLGFCLDNLSGVEPLDQYWAVNGWVHRIISVRS